MFRLLFHVQLGSSFEIFVEDIDLVRESCFLVILLLIYSVTKKEFTLLCDAAGFFFFLGARHRCHSCDTDVDHYRSWTSLCLAVRYRPCTHGRSASAGSWILTPL